MNTVLEFGAIRKKGERLDVIIVLVNNNPIIFTLMFIIRSQQIF